MFLSMVFLTASGCAGTPADGHSDAKAMSDNHESGDHKTAHNDHDEPRPYYADRDAKTDLEATLAAAMENNKLALVVMGANWCHDSRGLAAQFEKERFQTDILGPHYELVYIDVAEKNRNIDIAQKFGLDDIVGTPTVFIIKDDQVLNLKTAPTWRNAASRTEDQIAEYFLKFGQTRSPED